MSPRPRARPGRGPVIAGLGLAAGLLGGCPSPEAGPGDAPAASREPPAPDPALRQRAHGQALAALRSEILPALRLLDPVAAAEVEGAPLRPPAFGAVARAALREALDTASRHAEGIRPELLSPEEGVVLRVLTHALARGRHRLERPPWRDDPMALLDAVEPYLHALQRRAAAGQCDDGCGLAALGPALETGLGEIGSASPTAVAAARAELAALSGTLPALGEGLPPTHALVTALPALTATLERLAAALAQASTALPAAPEVAWDQPVAPAEPTAWTRRPVRWTATRLRRALEDEEALGLPPAQLLAIAERTTARLHAMRRHAGATGSPDGTPTAPPEPALPRPFDAAGCEASWAPLQRWAQAQGLEAALDCAAMLRRLPPAANDVAIARQLVVQGIVEPTRGARVAATGVDVALVQGRAAPLAQGLVLEIAVASHTGRATAKHHALRAAHQRACLAMTAAWIHGALGDDAGLRTRLDAHGCEDAAELVAQAEARPAAALRGLGLGLIGDGPADAAALDRYSWAPMGLVRDLALPPPPAVEPGPTVQVEALGDRETAQQRLAPEAPTGDGNDPP